MNSRSTCIVRELVHQKYPRRIKNFNNLVFSRIVHSSNSPRYFFLKELHFKLYENQLAPELQSGNRQTHVQTRNILKNLPMNDEAQLLSSVWIFPTSKTVVYGQKRIFYTPLKRRFDALFCLETQLILQLSRIKRIKYQISKE